MRKGKGELTYHQLKVINEDLKRQIRNLEAERDKINNDYNSLKIAHKKALAELKELRPPQQKVELSSMYGRMGGTPDNCPPSMGFIGRFGGGALRDDGTSSMSRARLPFMAP